MSNSRALTNGKDETRASTEESVKVLVPAAVVNLPSPKLSIDCVQADFLLLISLFPCNCNLATF